MSFAAVRISNLNPYVGTKIKDSDVIPINSLNLDGVTYSTFKITGSQIKTYVSDSITDQKLFKSSSVQFSAITGLNSVSSTNITASNFFGDGSRLTNVFNQALNTNNNVKFNSLTASNIQINQQSVVSKFTDTITHIGTPAEQVYTINHPFMTADVVVQLYEILGNGITESASKVIASITNQVGNTTGVTQITVHNLQDAVYKVIILG